jgi:hypothetical protein
MIVLPMFSIATTGLSIAPPNIAPFRWGCDSNPWVPLMLHYLLQPHRQTLPMFNLRWTKPPDSLSRFSTSTNKSMRFCRKPMLSTSNAMINTGYHTSFRWETRSSYIFIKSVGPWLGKQAKNQGEKEKWGLHRRHSYCHWVEVRNIVEKTEKSSRKQVVGWGDRGWKINKEEGPWMTQQAEKSTVKFFGSPHKKEGRTGWQITENVGQVDLGF